jgi:hypothetical protein
MPALHSACLSRQRAPREPRSAAFHERLVPQMASALQGKNLPRRGTRQRQACVILTLPRLRGKHSRRLSPDSHPGVSCLLGTAVGIPPLVRVGLHHLLGDVFAMHRPCRCRTTDFSFAAPGPFRCRYLRTKPPEQRSPMPGSWLRGFRWLKRLSVASAAAPTRPHILQREEWPYLSH